MKKNPVKEILTKEEFKHDINKNNEKGLPIRPKEVQKEKKQKKNT